MSSGGHYKTTSSRVICGLWLAFLAPLSEFWALVVAGLASFLVVSLLDFGEASFFSMLFSLFESDT